MPVNRTKTGQFMPGASGNPRGRPKMDEAVTKALRAASREAAEALIAMMNDPDMNPKIRLAAANSILDRAYGKPTQRVEADVAAEGISIMLSEEIKEFAK